MALTPLFEGTPQGFPVQPLNYASPIYWEAGVLGMVDANGNVVVSDGVSNVIGIIADRRNVTVAPSIASYLPSTPGQIGDMSLFNQPGHGNSLFGQTGSTNNVIPGNTVPTVNMLRDETSANPNASSRKVTVYTRGGQYLTDQFDATQTYVPGQTLYCDTVGGRFTNQTKTFAVGIVTAPVDGNGFLQVQLGLVV